MPEKSAVKKETASNNISFAFNDAPSIIGIFFTLAPAITGIDRRKENLTAASLFNPAHKPAIIVMPDLDVPGIKATA